MAFFIFPLISARDLDIGLRVGFYNAIKTLAFASYFCKMRVKFLYWSPTGELIFSEHFHSITDRISFYMFQTFIKKNKTFTWHYKINVVTGIINEPKKLWLPDIVIFALFTFRTRNFITFIKVLNHMLLTLASDHNQQKSKTFLQNFSLNISLLN
jgi:hypothetical protein